MFTRRTALPFVDLVLILLCWIVLLIHPPVKQSNAKPVADFVLFVAWDMGRNTDVDVYVRGPDDKIAWFNGKDRGYMSIDRDDLGNVRDSGPLNQEIVGFRAPPDGSYFVSIHNYREDAKGPGTVILELDDRRGTQLWTGAVPIPPHREETAVIEFVFKGGAFVASYPSDALIRQGYYGGDRP